jgi:GntR family transcriptional regulator/MocR family aminotransferase
MRAIMVRGCQESVPPIRSDLLPVQRTNSSLAFDLLIELRRDRRVPLHRQIEAAVRDGIRSGRLQLDSPLPPTRTMATQLGVSRGVVVEAYQQLVAEGYLTSRPGGYTRVAVGPESLRKRARPAAEQAPAIDFGYGRADVSSFPRAAWLRSIRRVLTETPDERFGYLSGRGVPELCEVLAEYLNRVRGTSADPESIVLCNGYAQGIALLVHVLARSGARRVALEDPSSGDDALPAAIEAGLEVVGVPVDEHGISVDALERSDADAVVLTPSHQWPVGAVLSAESRGAILRWAKRRGALVIEDDYDAEYRYDRAPIGAMQGLAPDHVVYAGTASKTLAPGLRLGWLILPARLVEPMSVAKVTDDRGSPVLDQLTFADFVARGEFDRHLRRMRPRYRRLRDALVGRLAERVPDLELIGVSAGLHEMAWLPPDLSEEALTTAALDRGLGVYGLKPYWVRNAGPEGLVFGYGGLSEPAVVEGIDLLADTIASLRR